MANLKQVEKSLGKKPKELEDAPVLRHELNYLWSLFVSLKNAAEGAISYTEIQAYISIYGDLSVFEIDLIRTLDDLHSLEVNKIG
jgi:hypothetical protein